MSRLSVPARRPLLIGFVLLLSSVGWVCCHPAYAARRYVRKIIRYRTVPTTIRPSSSLSSTDATTQFRRVAGSAIGVRNAADARTVSIYISRRTPNGVSQQQWRESIRVACAAWFESAGCAVQIVSDRASAEIVFNVAILGSNIMGESRLPSALVFPRVPSPTKKARVFVNRNILSLGHRNLLRTLKHEVGHVIGLPHDSRSVVGRHHSDLTIHDARMIERFRSHLDRNWPQ